MIVFQTIAVALSLYSAIPMPQFDWNSRNMRYAMAAFPLVGVLCGVAVFLWAWLCGALAFGPILTAAGLCLVPVLVSGGIHLDGFCDTTDALASHASREKKLEIMKDSHAGAFAIIGVCCYLLFFLAVCTELPTQPELLLLYALIFVFSRAASGLAVASFPCAKNSGLVSAFADGAAKRQVRAILIGLLVLLSAVLIALNPLTGGLMVLTAAVVFGCYYTMSMRVFGGITGDLAGWFLQLCELFMTLALVSGLKLG